MLLIAITAPFSIGFFANDTVGIVSLFVGALIGVLCVTFVALLYAPAMMARTNGKTVGRMALGIRVVRANGEPIDFGYAMLREVLRQGAPGRHLREPHRRASLARSTTCGRSGTRRTARSTTSSWTPA